MQNTLVQLRKLTLTALSELGNIDLLREAIKGMQELYTGCTGIRPESFSEEGITLPSGLAISPYQAADCLPEMERTVVFLRGIYKAILVQKEKFPGERVNIFYAGCGPYAALLTPFITLFTKEELGFWLLDISAESIDAVQKLYTAMGAGGYVIDYICTDAAMCVLPSDRPVHIVISETMQKTLWQEPQVAVMLNLLPQMTPASVFIPEEITVSVKLISAADNIKFYYIGDFSPENINLGTIYSIGRNKYARHSPVELQLPADTGQYCTVNMFTEITVFGDEKLVPYASTLNLPVFIDDVNDRQGWKLRFTYQHTSSPGFTHEWIK